MKILHLSSEKTWRGGEQQIANLLRALQAQGVENYVACRTDSAFARYCQQHQIPHTELPFRGSYDRKTNFGLRQIVQDQNPDLMHLHTPRGHAQGVLAHKFGKLKLPMILSRRVDFVPKSRWFTRWKYNYAGIARVLTVSELIGQIMQAYLREPKKVIAVHSGIDPSRFDTPPPHTYLRDTYGIDRHTPIIGNTSALAPHKDYITFLDTAAELTRQGLNAHYVIMGEGELRQELERHTAKLNLSNRVTFTGFLDNLGAVLPELDVFLMTSEEEGLGTSILDAFAARVPVVATAAGGIPEMVLDERTGLLADVKKPMQLARQIMRVLGDHDFAEALTTQAQALLLEKFTYQQTAKKTLQVYREVLEDRA